MDEDVREEPSDILTSCPGDRRISIASDGDFSAFHVQIHDPMFEKLISTLIFWSEHM
jgi:hypothetical protein